MPCALLVSDALPKCGIDFLPETAAYKRWWTKASPLWPKIKHAEDPPFSFPAELWVLKEALWKSLSQDLQLAYPTAASLRLFKDESNYMAVVNQRHYTLQLLAVEQGMIGLCWPTSMPKPAWGDGDSFPPNLLVEKFKMGRTWRNATGQSGWLSITHEEDMIFWAGWLERPTCHVS